MWCVILQADEYDKAFQTLCPGTSLTSFNNLSLCHCVRPRLPVHRARTQRRAGVRGAGRVRRIFPERADDSSRRPQPHSLQLQLHQLHHRPHKEGIEDGNESDDEAEDDREDDEETRKM